MLYSVCFGNRSYVVLIKQKYVYLFLTKMFYWDAIKFLSKNLNCGFILETSDIDISELALI